jgi:hypothetical protein
MDKAMNLRNEFILIKTDDSWKDAVHSLTSFDPYCSLLDIRIFLYGMYCKSYQRLVG